jgi:hypothetical protein
MRKFTKKVLIIASTLSMLATSSVFAAESSGTNFKDVPASHWANSSIQAMVAMGVVSGYPDGTFKPDSPVKADEFLKMFTTALTEPATIDDPIHLGKTIETRVFKKPFFDSTDYGIQVRLTQYQNLINLNTVPTNGYWATYYVSMGKSMGLVNGMNDPFLKFSDDLTREQLAYIIHNFLYFYEPRLDESYTQLAENAFKDAYNVSADLKDDVNLAVTKGIISGYEDGTFKPLRPVSRAESLAIIDRLVNSSKRIDFKPQIDGKYTIQSVVKDQSSVKVTPYKEIYDVALKLKGISGDNIWTNQTVFYIYKDAVAKSGYLEGSRTSINEDWVYAYTGNPYLVNFRVDAYSYGVITRNLASASIPELKLFANAIFGNQSQEFTDLIIKIYKDNTKTGDPNIDDYKYIKSTTVTIGDHKVSYHRNQATLDLTFLIEVVNK